MPFTGVDKEGVIRSLPLPTLSAVTRQSAKEYFNNSWTLYETLFAGLKGEEGFYRYVLLRSLIYDNVESFLLQLTLSFLLFLVHRHMVFDTPKFSTMGTLLVST